MKVVFPPPEEDERARRFQVHMFYLSNLSGFLRHNYGASDHELLDGLLRTQRTLAGFCRIQRRRSTTDPVEVKRCLAISWASELQIALNANADRALLRYSNVWTPVHAYYATYFSMHAWFAAMGGVVDLDDHTSTLRYIATQITNRKIFPAPWAGTCSGSPHLKETQFERFPGDFDARRPCELLSRPDPDTFWLRFGKMLETTRKLRLDRQHREWLKVNDRKLIRADEKRRLALKLPNTTLFDYLWRLRVRSNYQDVSSFVTSSVGDDWQHEFYHSLSIITWTTLATIEALIIAYAGPDVLNEAYAEFIRHDAPSLENLTRALQIRREHLLA
ncbi:MAG TPA: hypothetical protein VFW71_12855 [Actinomycetota bacterium]|nr:hypothetical protein [Actinomycetota bacterium]